MCQVHLAAIRNQVLYSAGMNEVIKERLYAFNHKPFQKRTAAVRRGLLRNEFRCCLYRGIRLNWPNGKSQPFPLTITSPSMTVLPVPFEYIKRKVDVRLTRSVVELFLKEAASVPTFACTAAADSIVPEDHMPPNHQQYIQWNGERFRKGSENW